MEEKLVVSTSVGNFQYAKMGNGIVVYLSNGTKVLLSANWWDKDEVIKAIEDHIDLINKKIDDKDDKKEGVSLNSLDDASNVLQEVGDFIQKTLDGKDKGFIKCRLTQIINKLNEFK